jgi:plastocyanin
MRHSRSFRCVGSLPTVGFMVGCGGDTTEPEPLTLAPVSGNGQTAAQGQPVSDPLVVRVTEGGNGVAGRTVAWTVTAGAGSVSPTSSSTDAAGMASTTWALGATAGANGVEASTSGATGSPATFTATGLGPAPQQAAVSIADNSFDPASQRVASGGTVTWTWTGNNMHDVTFNSGPNSATQPTGTFSRDFPSAGSFNYLCTVHGSAMSGTIVVE